MTAVVTLRCDVEGCDETSGDYGWTSAKQIRDDLGDVGWRHVGRKDYCPDHRADASYHNSILQDRRYERTGRIHVNG